MSTTTKVLYAVYVAIVLLVSGTARADETSVQISHVGLDQRALHLYVSGHLPNPCFADPSASIVRDSQDPNTLILRLEAPIPMHMCVTRVQPFAQVINLPALAKASLVPIEDKALYIIKTEGYDFSFAVFGSDLMN